MRICFGNRKSAWQDVPRYIIIGDTFHVTYQLKPDDPDLQFMFPPIVAELEMTDPFMSQPKRWWEFWK